MGARVIETKFYRVIFIETESRSCTPFVYTVRVDRSRYNDAYVRMPVSKTSRSTASQPLQSTLRRFGYYLFLAIAWLLPPKAKATNVSITTVPPRQ
jgi:hypothetical protein